jgi:hypothetical protein
MDNWIFATERIPNSQKYSDVLGQKNNKKQLCEYFLIFIPEERLPDFIIVQKKMTQGSKTVKVFILQMRQGIPRQVQRAQAWQETDRMTGKSSKGFSLRRTGMSKVIVKEVV